jgi:hypothetical protein
MPESNSIEFLKLAKWSPNQEQSVLNKNEKAI